MCQVLFPELGTQLNKTDKPLQSAAFISWGRGAHQHTNLPVDAMGCEENSRGTRAGLVAREGLPEDVRAGTVSGEAHTRSGMAAVQPEGTAMAEAAPQP